MLGFSAISELPLSTTPTVVSGDTLAGASLLSAAGSVSVSGAIVSDNASAISASGSIASNATIEKSGASALNQSSSTAIAGVVEISAKSAQSMAADTSLSVQLKIAAVSLIAESSTVSPSAVLVIDSESSISKSGSLTSNGISEIGGLSAFSASGSLSSGAIVDKLGQSQLEKTGTISATSTSQTSALSAISMSGSLSPSGRLDALLSSSTSVSGTVSTNGQVSKLGQAKIGSNDAFTTGFTKGFLKSNFMVGTPHIDGARLIASSSITPLAALGTGKASLSAIGSAIMAANPFGEASLDITASLSPNSVLLIGGDAELLTATSILSGILTSPNENQDVAKFTLYLDKARDVDGFIRKTVSIDVLMDSQRLLSGYLDKQNSLTGYIDKQVDKDLVRER